MDDENTSAATGRATHKPLRQLEPATEFAVGLRESLADRSDNSQYRTRDAESRAPLITS
jgi:hypothetical protein